MILKRCLQFFAKRREGEDGAGCQTKLGPFLDPKKMAQKCCFWTAHFQVFAIS